MEARYEEVMRVLGELDMAIEEYNDFEADEAGRVPKDLSREVLSEDGLYDFLSGADNIIAFAKESFR